jgi:hypothetical protein
MLREYALTEPEIEKLDEVYRLIGENRSLRGLIRAGFVAFAEANGTMPVKPYQVSRLFARPSRNPYSRIALLYDFTIQKFPLLFDQDSKIQNTNILNTIQDLYELRRDNLELLSLINHFHGICSKIPIRTQNALQIALHDYLVKIDAEAPDIECHVDEIDVAGCLRGWAVCHAQPDEHVNIRVLDNDDAVVAGGLADSFRPDVAERGKGGDGRNGFILPLKKPIIEGPPRVLKVYGSTRSCVDRLLCRYDTAIRTGGMIAHAPAYLMTVRKNLLGSM